MPVITDPEFGEIVVRRHSTASRIALRVAPDGRLRASVPRGVPTVAVKLLVKTSRGEIRQLLSHHHADNRYDSDRAIGKSHALVISRGSTATKITMVGTKIIVNLAEGDDITSLDNQATIRQIVIKALRKEAKSYLPRRLRYLAEEHGFTYDAVKLTHASSRWGSCSSSGTISLNIGLMQLPFELIDYVLIHELSHTRQMNHSPEFWRQVGAIDPSYIQHRRELKKRTPNV